MERPHDTKGGADGDKEGEEADVFGEGGGASAEGVAAGFRVNSGVGLGKGDETSGEGGGETEAILPNGWSICAC